MKQTAALILFAFLLFTTVGAIAETIIIDNLSDDFSVSGTWDTGTYAGYHVTDYRWALTVTGSATATATWSPTFDTAGTYEVAVWYVQGSNRPTDAEFIITHTGGPTTVYVDQTTSGSQWVVLGSYTFPASAGSVQVSNLSSVASKAVMADAVRFVRSGTTYGDAYQGMWIQSWVSPAFFSEAETDLLIATARTNYLNAIFPEVRKVGDAYYVSATEPRASNIDPAYTDPLADMLTKAHDTSGGKQHIEVHAWIVPYRVRVGADPLPSGHVLSEHPDWVMYDNGGSTWDGTTQYLDPGHPEVLDYLVDVITEIVTNYDVDGIHFDYFRYPGTTWGYNPVSIARFNALYGKSGQPATNDPDFCDFRRDQIRHLGRKAYVAVKALDWDCNMSAATIQWGSCPVDFTLSSAYASVFQDWVGFMSEGVLDMNVLMNYKREYNTSQAADYRDWVQKLADTKAGRHANNGPGVYMNHIHDSVTQILYALDTSGIDGTNCYVYQVTNMDGDPADDFWYTMRADCFTQRRNIPAAPWLDTPTQGILHGTVTGDGSPLDGATITLSSGASGTSKTDGTGFYAFLKLDPGTNFTATASATGYISQAQSFNITAGNLTQLDFALTSPTPTPTPMPTPTPTPGIPDWQYYGD